MNGDARWWCRRLELADVCQVARLKVWQAAKGYDPARPAAPYIVTTIRRALITERRATHAAIHLEVWETTGSGTQVGAGEDLDPADVILDALDTGYLADDDTGFNLRIDLDGNHFPEGGKTYRVEVLITPTAGDPWYRLWELTTLNVFSD